MHYFHSYAVLDRIESISTLTADKPVGDFSRLSALSYLQNAADCMEIKKSYAILLARVLIAEVPYFQRVFHDCAVEHIPHKYSSQMAEK